MTDRRPWDHRPRGCGQKVTYAVGMAIVLAVQALWAEWDARRNRRRRRG